MHDKPLNFMVAIPKCSHMDTIYPEPTDTVSPRELSAYRRYIESKLDRMEYGGFRPMCISEFAQWGKFVERFIDNSYTTDEWKAHVARYPARGSTNQLMGPTDAN